MNQISKQRVLSISAGAVVIVAVIYLFWLLRSKPSGSQQNVQTAPPMLTPTNTIRELPTTQTAPGLPKDIVLANDAHVLNSYTATTPQGKQQLTLIYTTKQAPSALYPAYKAYLSKNSWQL